MSKKIISCKSTCNIYDVAKLMKENNIGFIPIIDDDLKGVITDRDIVIKNIFNKDEKIKSYLNKNVITIDENANINDTLTLMSKYKIKRLVVTNNNKVTGIISLSDILNTQADNSELINTFKSIYQIKNNEQNKDSEIDDYYL